MQLKELIFAGTGASSGLPIAACINRLDYVCPVCNSALTLEGAKNRRNNTSLIIVIENAAGVSKTILIDCGKTFNSSTLECFLKNKIRRIDAVILTHGHADAMLGLDDLRPWCGLAQSYCIPVFLDQSTMEVVKSAFPYLVDTSKATGCHISLTYVNAVSIGGGEVSSLNFNIIDHNVPFKVEGIEFIPLPVEHGFHADRTPFMSLGFRFGDVSYISDASRIPESTRKNMYGSKTLILDCLRHQAYSSHFGIDQALEECAKINPDHAFFVGMSHSLDHYEFETFLKTRSPSQGSYLAPAYDGLKLTVNKSGRVTSFS